MKTGLAYCTLRGAAKTAGTSNLQLGTGEPATAGLGCSPLAVEADRNRVTPGRIRCRGFAPAADAVTGGLLLDYHKPVGLA